MARKQKKLRFNWVLLGIAAIIAAAAVITWVTLLYTTTPPKITQINLPHLYSDKNNGFLIKYPVEWTFTEPRTSTVMFKGKKDSQDTDTTIVISKVTYQKPTGIYLNTQAYLNFIKGFFQKVQTKPTTVEEGPIEVTQVDGKILKGRYLILKYTFQNKQYIQYEIVLDKQDGKNFYVLGYNAPVSRYPQGLPVFKTMLKTFKAE